MSSHVRGAMLTALVLAAAPLGAQRYVDSSDPQFPRVQYADSSVSVNDRCIVRLRTLTPKVPAIYVNGRPIGFC